MNIIEDIPIYWINLERNPERKKIFESQLKNFNINNATSVIGIDGANLDTKDYNCSDGLTKFVLGCTLSHLKAIKTAYDNNDSMALIMENDCNFEYLKYQKLTIKELVKILELKDKNWDILQLAMCNRHDHNLWRSTEKELILKGFKNCAACYLINRNGMQKKLIENRQYLPADYHIYKGVNTYHLSKPYFTYHYSNILQSSIHNGGVGVSMNTKKLGREDSSKKFWDEYYEK